MHSLHPFRRDQESGALRRDAAATAAAAISALAHPFLLIPLTVALVTRSVRWTAIIAATTTVPLTLLILRNVRSGRFGDFDVSNPAERPGLYRIGFPLLALVAVVMFLLDAPGPFLRSTAALAVVFAIGLGANRWLKTSLHMIFAAFCALLIVRTYPAWWLVPAVVVLAVGWSRWRLTRHTVPEIAVGLVLGLAAGLVTITR